jgi:hypothetical protein
MPRFINELGRNYLKLKKYKEASRSLKNFSNRPQTAGIFNGM